MRLVSALAVFCVMVLFSPSAQAVNSKLYQHIYQLDCALTITSNGSGTVVTPGCSPQNPRITSVVPNWGQPTITGLYDAAHGGSIVVTLNGVTYSPGAGSRLQVNGNMWTLNLSQLSPPLLPGAYDVSVIHTLGDGSVLTDATTNEMTVSPYDMGLPTVTPIVSLDGKPIISGTFNASHTDSLQVTVAGQLYQLGVDPQLTAAGNTWKLDLSGLLIPLPFGAYDVSIQATLLDGQVDEDNTTNELLVQRPDADAPTVSPTTWVGGQPKIKGTYDAANSVSLRVFVAGKWYVLGVSPELTAQGNNWYLDLSNLQPPLAVGTYEVIVQVTSRDGSVYGNLPTQNLTILPLNIINVIKDPTHSPLASTGMNSYKAILFGIIAIVGAVILFVVGKRRKKAGQ